MNSTAENINRLDEALVATLDVQEKALREGIVVLGFKLSNRSKERLLFLSWYTPLEGLAGDIFQVERDGEPIPYRGMLVKRGVPHPDEYVSIEPGETLNAEIDLAEGYDFSKRGKYSIEFRSPSISYLTNIEAGAAKRLSDLGPVKISSRPISVQIVENIEGHEDIKTPKPKDDESESGKEITYDDCTNTQENTIKTADTAANVRSTLIYAYLNGLSEAKRKTDALYKRWFGAYTSARYTKVLGNWKKIRDSFSTEDITYKCGGSGCKPSTYAYVYPGGKLEVFLCAQFWAAPDTGVDTKFGTLIHEVSHEVANTKDHVYSQTKCLDLAKTNPDKAIENADNYEYFAEEYKLPEGCIEAIKKFFKNLFGN